MKFSITSLFALVISGIAIISLDQAHRLLKSKDEKIGGAFIALLVFISFDILAFATSLFFILTLVISVIVGIGILIAIYAIIDLHIQKAKFRKKHMVVGIIGAVSILLLVFPISALKPLILAGFEIGGFHSQMLGYYYNSSYIQFTLVTLPQLQMNVLFPRSELFSLPKLISALLYRNISFAASTSFALVLAINSSQISLKNISSAGLALSEIQAQNLPPNEWQSFNLSSSSLPFADLYLIRNGSTLCGILFNNMPQSSEKALISAISCYT